MAFRKLVLTGALALSVSALTPAKASADWLFTPFIGGTFGGSAKITDISNDDKEEFNRKLTYGASIGYLGAGIAGFEIDFGYSPNFFESDPNDSLNLVGDGNVTTMMANFMLAAPKAPIRPYASFGGGLIKTRVDGVTGFFDDIDDNSFGFDVGAGLMGYFNDNVAIRGDVRFFRRLNNDSSEDNLDVNLDSFKFWRGTVGVTFRF
jgi:opacity protein-like surface antigen